MDHAQEIFLVFFAIVWGTSAGAWSKWKPFQWPFFFYSCRVQRRVILSFTMFNVFPLIFFAWALRQLGLEHPSHTVMGYRDISAGIVPAFAMFGFYRVWLAAIEYNPRYFFYKNKEQENMKPYLQHRDPTIEWLHINDDNGALWSWKGNGIAGVIYIVVGIRSALVL